MVARPFGGCIVVKNVVQLKLFFLFLWSNVAGSVTKFTVTYESDLNKFEGFPILHNQIYLTKPAMEIACHDFKAALH